eukprot:scaffold8315_cov54-Phaeocystis_antarctica.AAC.5
MLEMCIGTMLPLASSWTTATCRALSLRLGISDCAMALTSPRTRSHSSPCRAQHPPPTRHALQTSWSPQRLHTC